MPRPFVQFDWRANGFATEPRQAVATGAEKLYRAWGLHPGQKYGNKNLPGVCFSFDRARSRSRAEILYAVMEYGNKVYHLTQFQLRAGAPDWIGKVHPGDPRTVLGAVSGNQVFILRQHLVFVREVSTLLLPDDLKPRGRFVPGIFGNA